jgi:hypothetical protein
VAARATASSARSITWQDPADTDANIAWAKETFETLRPHLADRQYLNNLPADDGRIAYGLWCANTSGWSPSSAGTTRTTRSGLNHNIDPRLASATAR